MLTKQQRFYFGKGVPHHSVQSPYFVMRFEKAHRCMVAVVVSKRIDPHAVGRNSIKRTYKRALTTLLQTHPLPYALVFYVRKKSSELSSGQLTTILEQIFKKHGII